MRVTPVEAIDKHRGLVFRCMRGIKIPPYAEFKDIEQAGFEGLLQAAKRYDPARDVKFSTFAMWYIKGHIMRAIYLAKSLLHIPMYQIENSTVTPHSVISIDWDEAGKWIPDPKQNIISIEDELDYYSLKEKFDLFFNLITPQQKKALELYYFTLNDKGHHPSYREVAEIMGISYERVRQLLDLGKKQLRNRFGKYLDVYI